MRVTKSDKKRQFTREFWRFTFKARYDGIIPLPEIQKERAVMTRRRSISKHLKYKRMENEKFIHSLITCETRTIYKGTDIE